MKKYIFLFCLLFIFSCEKDEINHVVVPELPQIPSHFPALEKPLIQGDMAGFELGKKLFYDPLLSRDNSISCASCHIQSAAFTHHGHDVSHGIDDKQGKRNAPPIQNLLWQKNYFWDGGVQNIELISVNPIVNPVEMDEKIPDVIRKLNASTAYKNLFNKVYHTSEITSEQMLNALGQFMQRLISAESKYDRYLTGKTSLTAEEKEGEQIFKAKCGSCHSGPLFTDNSFRNNGMLDQFNFEKGRYDISLLDADLGKFKVPSLRNLVFTAPYMHNGSIGNLEGVLDYYRLNVKDSPTLDPLLKSNGRLGIELNKNDKEKIILFLHTLTDSSFVKNPLFSQ